MKKAEIIKRGQDKDGMLRRALERIIQLYTDKAHFVYELLQNAEDCGATNIKFEQFADRLEVYHDGRPFTDDNLRRLCDIALSDKEGNLNQIGEFGVGFKSVFSICDTVRLYSAPGHYKGTVPTGADQFSVEIKDFVNPVDIPDIEMSTEYTTMFVFPYCAGESFSGFKDIVSLRTTLAARLKGLDVTTLLFMKSLKEIKYVIHGKDIVSGNYLLDTKNISDKCILVSAIGENVFSAKESKEQSISYLKFSRQIKNSPRSVDIAFTVRHEGSNKFTCIKSNSPFVSVYFPTGTESKVDFIVQGPFRTTPDRSSIPSADDDNIALSNELAILLGDSLAELKRLNILNMSFIRCLPIDKNRFSHLRLLYPLYEETERLLRCSPFLPSKSGEYVTSTQAKMTTTRNLANIFSDKILTEFINDSHKHYWLPTDITDSSSEYNYQELFKYLTSVCDVDLIRPESLRSMFNSNEAFLYNRDDEWLTELYNYLSSIPAELRRDGRASLIFSKIVKTASGKFVAPYRLTENRVALRNVFIPSNTTIWGDIEFVDNGLYNRCKSFFEETLALEKPNEYQFFTEYVRRTYGNGIIPEESLATDISWFLKFLHHPEYGGDMRSLMEECFLLRCYNKNGAIAVNPYTTMVFSPESDEGISIEDYYRNVFDYPFVDVDYYIDKGIETEKILDFGVHNSIVIGHTCSSGYSDLDNTGNSFYWNADGEFRPEFSLDRIKDILKYISEHPNEKDSILKSRIIFKLLQMNESKLSGTLHIRGCVRDNENCFIVKLLRKDLHSNWNGKWLYSENGDLVSQKSISKRSLNTAYYGELVHDSKLYEILDFKVSADDERENAEKEYYAIPEEKRRRYFEIELQKTYGISLDDFTNTIREHVHRPTDSTRDLFEFPSFGVRNWASLKKHALEMYAVAEPVKFEEVVRRIRTTRHPEDAKNYLRNMYQYDGVKKCACQLCHEPIDSDSNGVQIFTKPEYELYPLHILLCDKCKNLFHSLQNNGELMDDLRNELFNMHTTFIEANNPVKIKIADKEIWFTQTHAAEVHELLVLMKNVQDCETVIDPDKKRKQPTPIDNLIDVDIFRKAINDKYRALVGKRVKHNKKGTTAIVKAFEESSEDSYLLVLIETGPAKGSIVRYAVSVLEKNHFLEVIDDK